MWWKEGVQIKMELILYLFHYFFNVLTRYPHAVLSNPFHRAVSFFLPYFGSFSVGQSFNKTTRRLLLLFLHIMDIKWFDKCTSSERITFITLNVVKKNGIENTEERNRTRLLLMRRWTHSKRRCRILN